MKARGIKHPEVGRGQTWGQQHADEWQALIEDVKRLEVEAPLEKRMGLDSVTLSLAPDALRKVPREKTVVIVEEPDESTAVLTVRTVAYTTPPDDRDSEGHMIGVPDGATINWASHAFRAYPDFGRKPVDYAEFALPVEAEGQLQEDTTYLTARFAFGVWVIRYPSEGAPAPRVVPQVLAQKFILQEDGAEHVDVLRCHRWNEELGSNQASDPTTQYEVFVKKPRLLQRLPFDSNADAGYDAPPRGGYSYEYWNNHERTVRNVEDPNVVPGTQSIQPPYVGADGYKGDVVVAVPAAVNAGRRTGMVVEEIISNVEVRVSGGTGTSFPTRVNFDGITQPPSMYQHAGLVFPEMLVRVGGRTLHAQLAMPETVAAGDPAQTQPVRLSIQPDHGLSVEDTIDIEWSYEWVDANDGRTWKGYVERQNVLLAQYRSHGDLMPGNLVDDYAQVLAPYAGQRVDLYYDGWEGNIHNYGLVIWVGGGTRPTPFEHFASKPFAGPILNGEWTGRVHLAGGPERSGANQSVNELSGITGMSVYDETHGSTGYSHAPVEEDPLTRGMDSLYLPATIAVAGGTVLSEVAGFPTAPSTRPWVAENTTVHPNGGVVSWVVSGNHPYLDGRPPWGGTHPQGYRNWMYLLNLTNVPVLAPGEP